MFSVDRDRSPVANVQAIVFLEGAVYYRQLEQRHFGDEVVITCLTLRSSDGDSISFKICHVPRESIVSQVKERRVLCHHLLGVSCVTQVNMNRAAMDSNIAIEGVVHKHDVLASRILDKNCALRGKVVSESFSLKLGAYVVHEVKWMAEQLSLVSS